MKETTLRGMVRSQIKKFIGESPVARAAVSSKLGSIEKMAGVKMLKKALSQGSPNQQAAGLLSVVKSISGNNPIVAKKLALLLRGKESLETPTEDPVTEYTAGVDDGSPIEEKRKVSSALASRKGRLDKTQAMQMMKKSLDTKPATQQVDFVISMLNDLKLKDSAKKRLVLKLRKDLE